MVRSAGGNNDHPDAVKFLYIYRLLSTYSLLRPSRGSNVALGKEETFDTFVKLMQDNEVIGRTEEPFTAREQFILHMDHAISNGSLHLPDDVSEVHTPQASIIEYVAGYIARQRYRFSSSCAECRRSLTGVARRGGFLAKCDKFAAMCAPSENLFALIQKLEIIVTDEIKELKDIRADTFLDISYRLDEEAVFLPLVGCEKHCDEVTHSVANFFFIMRMNAICKAAKRMLANKTKSQSLRKQAKLVK